MSLINQSIQELEEEKKAKLPKKLYIGFEKGASKSDLKDVLCQIS